MLLEKLASQPQWFFGIDSIFELFALIVASIIAFYGYRIYKVSGEPKYHHFSLSFIFLALALFARGVLDIYSFSAIKQFGFSAFLGTTQSAIYNAGTDIYRLLYLAGYALLIKALYNLDDLKKSVPLLAAVFIGVLGGKYIAFILPNIVALAFLAILGKYFYNNYSRKKSLNSKLTLSAFALIGISEILFILMAVGSPFAFYVLAHLCRMVGFVILAYNLYLVFKK